MWIDDAQCSAVWCVSPHCTHDTATGCRVLSVFEDVKHVERDAANTVSWAGAGLRALSVEVLASPARPRAVVTGTEIYFGTCTGGAHGGWAGAGAKGLGWRSDF